VAIFSSFDQGPAVPYHHKKERKMEHSRSPAPSPDSPSAAGTVIPESFSVIVVHEARKQLPKARGGSSHMGIDKAFDKRVRVTEEQKAKTVQHWQRTGLSYTLLGEWCKEEFSLEKAPSNAVLCLWIKPEKRNQLLKFLETETCPAKLSAKANYLPDHPEVEDELFEWFRRHEQRQAVITDDVLQTKFKELCTKRKIEVKASRSWVRKFKARRGIGLKVLHGEAASADKQWVSVSRAI
jgi:hypothetical protein